MQTLRYDRTKLILWAVAGSLLLALFVWMFLNADMFTGSRRGRFLASGIGHWVFMPLLIGLFGGFVWRSAALAIGSLEAISITKSALIVTGMWGRRRIAWADLGDVVVESAGGQPNLAFRRRSGGLFGRTAARVPLKLTQLHPARTVELIESILLMRARIAPLETAAAVEEAALSGPRSFDPDEAMARYLARKAAEEGGTPAAAPPPPAPAPNHAGPPRPTFGRKGL